MENNQSNLKGWVIFFAALFFMTLIGAGFYWSKSREFTVQNNALSAELTVLNEVRDSLVADVESMTNAYNQLLASNDSLQQAFAAQTKVVQKKEAQIRQIKNQAAVDAAGMKGEIDQLRQIQKEMIALVEELKMENAQLRTQNSDLAQKVSISEEMNLELSGQVEGLTQLSDKLEGERNALMASAARATNIRVDVMKKSDKPTSSFRRAKELAVSFNVSNLPKDMIGKHELFVVIKDATGNVVQVDNPIKTTIRQDVNGATEEIIAQQAIEVMLSGKGQERFEFEIAPTAKTLKKGYYRADIYASWGLLGAAQFQLR